MPSRRDFLAGMAGAIGAAAGCLGRDASRGETWLARYDLFNRHTEPHTVTVEVRLDGRRVHRETYDVAAHDGDDTVDNGVADVNEWPRRRGRFVVAARMDGGPTRTFDSVEAYERDFPCTQASVQIDPRGSLAIWHTTNCEELEVDPPADG